MALEASILCAALPGLYRYALELTRDRDRAADLVQDTAERAWRARAHYVETGALGTWLRTIMRRTFIDEWRERGCRPTEVSLDQCVTVLPYLVAPQPWHVYAREISRQLGALPAGQRRLLTSAIDRASDPDVAAELGLTPARMRKERFKLRRRLCPFGGAF